MACPVCQDLTPTDLCAKCRGMSQKSAVILTTRMHRWERTYQHLAEVSCQDCCHVACSLCQSEITQFSNFFIYFSDLLRLFWFSWYQVTLCVFGLPGILQARAMYTWPEVIWTFQEDPWQFVTTRRPPTTTGMSPQGRKLDRRWRQQKGFTASRVGMGDILMRTPAYESLLVSVEFQMARTVI